VVSFINLNLGKIELEGIIKPRNLKWRELVCNIGIEKFLAPL
jgi:hypothetical protein